MHVGHDGSGNARELEQNVENFCKKPVEWVVGPDRCASTASAPRSSRTTRSPSRAHTRRGGVSPQLQCMIKGDETRGVVACAYDAACGLCAPYATVRASAVRSNLVLRTLVADFSDEGDGFMLPALAALRCIHNRTVPDSQRV